MKLHEFTYLTLTNQLQVTTECPGWLSFLTVGHHSSRSGLEPSQPNDILNHNCSKKPHAKMIGSSSPPPLTRCSLSHSSHTPGGVLAVSGFCAPVPLTALASTNVELMWRLNSESRWQKIQATNIVLQLEVASTVPRIQNSNVLAGMNRCAGPMGYLTISRHTPGALIFLQLLSGIVHINVEAFVEASKAPARKSRQINTPQDHTMV